MKVINTVAYYVMLCLLSCESSPRNVRLHQTISTDSNTLSVTKLDTNNKVINSTDTIHFLNNCSELMTNTEVGALMGINKDNDSTGYLCFAECYDCKEVYQIIFVHKGGVSVRKKLGYEEISKEFHNGCNNNFESFDCFAFVNPMRDPDKQKDEHAMNIDFPVIVKIYKRTTGDNWKFIERSKTKTFEEYQMVLFKTIYEIK